MKTLGFLSTFSEAKGSNTRAIAALLYGDTTGEPGLERSCPYQQALSLLPQGPVARGVVPGN